MLISHCILHIELPQAHSLKGRRTVVNSVKERLKRLNLSVMDVSGEYPKEADIALVYLSPDARSAAQYREKIEAMLTRYFGEYLFEFDCERF